MWNILTDSNCKIQNFKTTDSLYDECKTELIRTTESFFKMVCKTHCLKSVRNWSYSDPHFPAFGLNTESGCSLNVAMFGKSREHLGNILKEKIF